MRRTTAVAAAVLALAIAGCADMGSIAANPKLQDADSLGLTASKAAPADAAPALDSQWWLAFGDAQLDTLIAQAIEGNPNLQIARARLARAQASVMSAHAADRPHVDGSLDLTRQKFSDNYIYPAPLGGSIQETGTLQIEAGWELDFFGKNRTAQIGRAHV